MSEPKATRVGVIGLGFMGRTHITAYAQANTAGHENRLVAVCDSDVERFTKKAAGGNLDVDGGDDDDGEPLFDPDQVRTYTDAEEFLADEELELVSICSPTESHVPLAIAALRAGKHVLVEKPLALTSAEVEELRAVSSSSNRLCMPAMCMRFWPGWRWLKTSIESGEYGPVRSAVFQRLAAPPSWSPDFYKDNTRTGGALFDLHVHDADFVRWLFGEPQSVSSTGSLGHVTTLYRFADGPAHVVAEGGWDHSPGFDFRMRFTVVFEKATADFDLAREGSELIVSRDGTSEPVELPAGTGYDGEIRHVLSAIAAGAEKLDATVEDALGLTRMLEAERASFESGATVSLSPSE